MLSVLSGEKRKKKKNGVNSPSSQHLIELRDVVKIYKTDAGDFPALINVDLIVEPGEFMAVIGKSGSGKSTLINMITGIDRPTSGEVFVNGTPIHTFNEGQMALWRGQSLGIVFQFFQLLPTLTVLENIMLPMDFAKLYTPKERRERAMHLLEQVDIGEHAHKLPTAISGGQQQRAAIARALANDPPILVADEPTGNLDSRTAGQVFELFGRLVEEGKTILMVTHDDDQAKRVSRTVIIADGEIVNEYLARALPSLSQEQQLKVTKQLETLTFGPGEPIIWQGADADKFFIIQKGQVNVYLAHPDGHETYVDELGPGEYFGEVALLRGSSRTATVRAARHNEVEVVALDADEFKQLTADSDLTLAALETEASRRSETVARVEEESR